MSIPEEARARLQFLARVVERQVRHLESVDARVFDQPFSPARARQLDGDIALAERVEAFASRFGRLQDPLGNKLLPALLGALGEPTGAMIDNLDRAERLGWLESVDAWLAARQWRNQMVHEYVEDPVVLADALQAAHASVPMLVRVAGVMRTQLQQRDWLGGDRAT